MLPSHGQCKVLPHDQCKVPAACENMVFLRHFHWDFRTWFQQGTSDEAISLFGDFVFPASANGLALARPHNKHVALRSSLMSHILKQSVETVNNIRVHAFRRRLHALSNDSMGHVTAEEGFGTSCAVILFHVLDRDLGCLNFLYVATCIFE